MSKEIKYKDAVPNSIVNRYKEDRLAHPEQEPVAWMFGNKLYKKLYGKNHLSLEERNLFIPLYTAPPKREPLSFEEIDKGYQESDGNYYDLAFRDGVMFAENHHGIGGGE